MALSRRLQCPHCNGPVAANPIGHWFQRFKCPHCGKPLQFDALTNNLGMLAWAFFAAMVLSLVLGRASWTTLFSAACAALWAVALLASYALRRIARG